jgi:hypothetical protein
MKVYLKEKMAEQAHVSWAGWMKYLFTKGSKDSDGRFIINADSVARWERQMDTPYAMLPENEKASDRVEAEAYFKVILDNGFILD